MVQLKPVTKENLEEVLSLAVNDDQQGFVSSTAVSLAQAYVCPGTAFPFAVCSGRDVVGFIMMGYYEKKKYYTLWKLLIDRNHQRKGYGRQALKQGVAFLQERFHVTEIFTGVSPGNTVAKKLYRSVGFVNTGVTENNMEELYLKC